MVAAVDGYECNPAHDVIPGRVQARNVPKLVFAPQKRRLPAYRFNWKAVRRLSACEAGPCQVSVPKQRILFRDGLIVIAPLPQASGPNGAESALTGVIADVAVDDRAANHTSRGLQRRCAFVLCRIDAGD